MSRKTLSQEERAKIVELMDSGYLAADISKMTGRNPTTINSVLREERNSRKRIFESKMSSGNDTDTLAVLLRIEEKIDRLLNMGGF